MQRITRAESRALLENDIDLAAGVLSGLIEDWDGLDDVRQRALLNMAFNLGPRLAGFVDFLAAVRARRWDAAAAEMINSKWAKQVGERAKRLAEMMRTVTLTGPAFSMAMLPPCPPRSLIQRLLILRANSRLPRVLSIRLVIAPVLETTIR